MAYVAAARNDVPQHCMTFLAIISSCLGKKQPAAAFCGMSHCAAPLFFKQQPSLSCCSMFLCATARNNVPQHCTAFRAVMSLCLDKKQPTAAFCGMPRHCFLCHGQVCHAMVKFVMVWSCFFGPWQEMMHHSI